MSLYSTIAPKYIPFREIIQSEIDELLLELEADNDLNQSVLQYAEKNNRVIFIRFQSYKL